MSIRYLLDTNILSEATRPTPNPAIERRIKEHADEIATAAIVWHEIWFGCLRLPRSGRRTALEYYLNNWVSKLPILPYNEAAALWHAAERVRLERLGKTPPFVDGQIIAVAKVNDLRLVTLNVRDFNTFEGVRVEDWR